MGQNSVRGNRRIRKHRTAHGHGYTTGLPFWHFIGHLGWRSTQQRTRQTRKEKVNTAMRKVESQLTISEFERFTTGQALDQQPRWWTLMNIVRQYWKVGNDHDHVNIPVSTYHYSPSQDPPRRQFCNCWPILHMYNHVRSKMTHAKLLRSIGCRNETGG